MSIQTTDKTLDSVTVIQTLRQQTQLFKQFKIKSLALFGPTSRDQATPLSVS